MLSYINISNGNVKYYECKPEIRTTRAMYISGGYFLLFFFVLVSRSSVRSALAFNYRKPPFLAFDPGIFSFSRDVLLLLHSISPFFSALPCPPFPRVTSEKQAQSFSAETSTLSSFPLVYRGTSIAAASREDCNFEARLSSRSSCLSLFRSLYLSHDITACPPLITFIMLLVSDTFARKSFPIDNRRLAAVVS